jgi:hypothetical protein
MLPHEKITVDASAVHIMTPESPTTTHYFLGSARLKNGVGLGFNEMIRAACAFDTL